MHIGIIIFWKGDAHKYDYILEGGCTKVRLYSGRGMHISMIIFWKGDAHRYDYILKEGCT